MLWIPKIVTLNLIDVCYSSPSRSEAGLFTGQPHVIFNAIYQIQIETKIDLPFQTVSLSGDEKSTRILYMSAIMNISYSSPKVFRLTSWPRNKKLSCV